MSAVLESTDTTEITEITPAAVEPRDEKLEIAITVTPEIQRVAHGSGALAIAQAWVIDAPDMAQALANERKEWAKRIDTIEAMKKDLFSPVKKAVEDMRAKLSAWFDAPLADLNAARKLAGDKLVAWEQAEAARIAREKAEAEAAARKARHEAEQKAAAERAKAAELERQKAEQAKREAEARAKAEAESRAAAEAERQAREAGNREAEKAAAEARRKADAEARARAAAEAKAEEESRAAIANGEAKAREAQAQAAAAVQNVPAVTRTAIAGQSLRDNWTAELKPGVTAEEAKLAIVKAIVENGRMDLLALFEIDTAARGPLNKLAGAQKNLMSVPGYVAVNNPTITGKRK